MTKSRSDMLDVLVIGCGPAGLAASLYCLEHGLRFQTVEKEDIGGTVRYYPRKKLVMTTPVSMPGYGTIDATEIRKEALITLWDDVIRNTGLEVSTGDAVTDIVRDGDGFTVTSTTGTHRAQRVVLAIGRRGVPRKLGVPGETLSKVIYSLLEPEHYQGDRILVVGGGDSAVEAALALAEQPGNDVTISYRRPTFARIKPANLERVNAAIDRRRVRVLWETQVEAIEDESVALRAADPTSTVPNDVVAIFAGGELPSAFLKRCGVAIDTKFGTP